MSTMKRVHTCPGINDYVRPMPEYLKCDSCGNEVEIWTDEVEIECKGCGARVARANVSCLQWCQFADKCEEIIRQKQASIPDKR